jgi:hypothetical protein
LKNDKEHIIVRIIIFVWNRFHYLQSFNAQNLMQIDDVPKLMKHSKLQTLQGICKLKTRFMIDFYHKWHMWLTIVFIHFGQIA